jgi:glutamyl-tRNA reductase
LKDLSTQLKGNFYALGLSYKKADASLRGKFSLPVENQEKLLKKAKDQNIPALTVISTCNRTELYGIAAHPYQLIKLLCEFTQGTLAEFEEAAYIYKGKEAVSHLFKVGTGLDSQILGDFEIISQLKNGFRLSKEMQLVNDFTERLINAVIQASKRIKTETKISTGATSVSFAAVQYILKNVPDISTKNIVLFGTGKIGKNTCENLIKHSKHTHITLINRTKIKAQELAVKFNLVVQDFSLLKQEISKTDILVVATGAQIPTINKEQLQLNKPLLIIDLSIPKNVNPEVAENPLVKLIHLDQLSSITDQTLAFRNKEVPKALEIISQIEEEFNTWARHRKFAPTIKALKETFSKIKENEIDFQKKKLPNFNEEQAQIISNRIIQKITTQFVNHLKNDEDSAQDSIELIKQVFHLEEV